MSSNFLVETMNGLVNVDMKAYHMIKTRQVSLIEEIDDTNIDQVIMCCDLLIEKEPTLPITLMMNSPGGNLDAAYRLIDYIEGSSTPFFAVATERCASAAASIFASLPAGHRLIMKHASIMIHQPLTMTQMPFNTTNLKNVNRLLADKEKVIFSDLARWTGQSIEKITEDCINETYLEGYAAVEYGIADDIYSAETLKRMEESLNA